MSWLDSMKITPISGGGAKGSAKGAKKARDFAQRRAAKLRESWTLEQHAAELARLRLEIQDRLAAGEVTVCPPMTPP